MGERRSPLVEELKSVQRTARDALRAVRDLGREVGGDVFGKFAIEADEPIDDEVLLELRAFLDHARDVYEDQELTLIVVAKLE